MKATLVNLTPHKIVLLKAPYNKQDIIGIIPPSGIIARCGVAKTTYDWIISEEDSTIIIPVTDIKYGKVNNLPPPKSGTLYIVSDVIANKMKGERNDLVIPGGVIRAPSGKVLGCKSLSFIK